MLNPEPLSPGRRYRRGCFTLAGLLLATLPLLAVWTAAAWEGEPAPLPWLPLLLTLGWLSTAWFMALLGSLAWGWETLERTLLQGRS